MSKKNMWKELTNESAMCMVLESARNTRKDSAWAVNG